MAIQAPHLDPAGNETVTGTWDFSGGGCLLPTVTRRRYLPARKFGQSNGTAMALTFAGAYPDRYEYWPCVTGPGTAPQAIGTTFDIPQDYVSGGTWKVVYTQSAVSANQWRAEVNVLGRVNGESAEGASEVVAVTITPDGNATNLQIDTIGTGGTLVAGDVVRVNLERDSAHADDTNPNDIELVGLIFEYNARESS